MFVYLEENDLMCCAEKSYMALRSTVAKVVPKLDFYDVGRAFDLDCGECYFKNASSDELRDIVEAATKVETEFAEKTGGTLDFHVNENGGGHLIAWGLFQLQPMAERMDRIHKLNWLARADEDCCPPD
jgi:hypothetical protein